MKDNNEVLKQKEDYVLLKIHRQYGKDESMKYLFDEISQLQFKIGELKSTNAELRDENAKIKKDSTKIKASFNPEWKKEEYVVQLKNNIKALDKKIVNLTKQVTEWRDKYCNVVAKEKI